MICWGYWFLLGCTLYLLQTLICILGHNLEKFQLTGWAANSPLHFIFTLITLLTLEFNKKIFVSQSEDLYSFNYTISILVLINIHLWFCMDTLLMLFYYFFFCNVFVLFFYSDSFLQETLCIDSSSVFSKSIIVKITGGLYDTRRQVTFFLSKTEWMWGDISQSVLSPYRNQT